MHGVVLIDDIDTFSYQSVFLQPPAKDRHRSDCRKRLLMRKMCVITNQFLLVREREMLEIYMYHNHRLRDLRPFVHSKTGYLVLSKVQHIIYLLQQYFSFFTEQDYKKIDLVAKEVLLLKQYNFLRDYLRLHSYRRCGLLYGISNQAVYCRLSYIVSRLQGSLFFKKASYTEGGLKRARKNIERAKYVLKTTKPLVGLIYTLQHYRAKL